MKDAILQAFVKLALCPGTPGDPEICTGCGFRNSKECSKDLKRYCYDTLLEISEPMEVREENLPRYITRTLTYIGVPTHLRGFQYLEEALLITVRDPETLTAITKEVYYEIAKKHRVSYASVEKAIRGALLGTWNRIGLGPFSELFGYPKSLGNPTNSEFISTVTRRILIELSIE